MDLYLLVNKILSEWRSEVYEQYDDLYSRMSVDKETRWVNSLLNQTQDQSELRQEYCEVCSTKLEKYDRVGHHPAGRKHCHKQITVCKDCHSVLSHWQYKWDSHWWLPDQPKHIRLAFLLLGLGDHYEWMPLKTGMYMYLRLGKKFTMRGSILLRKGGDVLG